MAKVLGIGNALVDIMRSLKVMKHLPNLTFQKEACNWLMRKSVIKLMKEQII